MKNGLTDKHSLAGANRGAMTIDEFCGWASLGRSKAYTEIASGRLTIKKIGRKSVVTMKDALAWLDSLPNSTNT